MATAEQSIRVGTRTAFVFPQMVLRVTTLVCADVVALSLAVLIAFSYWAIVNPTIPRHHAVMYLSVALCIGAFAFHGLYPAVGLSAVQYIRLIARSICFVFFMLSASMVLVKDWWANSRGGFFMSWTLSLALVPIGRWILKYWFGNRAWWRVPVLILGAGETARAVIRNLEENEVLSYQPMFCLDDDPHKQGLCEGIPVVGSLLQAESIAAEYNIRCAIVAMPRMSRCRLMLHMRRWVRAFPNIMIIPDLLGVGSLWVAPHDLGGVLSLEMQNQLLNPFNQIVKRGTDLLVGSICAVFALPVIAAAAVWIKVVSPGSPFYSQEREGRGGSPIRVLKLRTMHPNAEGLLARHLEEDPVARAEWDQFCKLRNDPRILPGIGRFLRRTSLDELPQLLNILRGSMSLVGPRPFPKYHNDRFDEDFRNLRVQMTPGLTGLWQIKARSNGNLDVQASLDTYYVRNWSLWFDLYILIRTFRVLIAQNGV